MHTSLVPTLCTSIALTFGTFQRVEGFCTPRVYPTLFRLSFCTPLTLINVATTPVGGNNSPVDPAAVRDGDRYPSSEAKLAGGVEALETETVVLYNNNKSLMTLNQNQLKCQNQHPFQIDN